MEVVRCVESAIKSYTPGPRTPDQHITDHLSQPIYKSLSDHEKKFVFEIFCGIFDANKFLRVTLQAYYDYDK
jgi:hypothetical protein